MCLPLVPILAIAGAVASAAGTMTAAIGTANQAKYAAGIDKNNATIANGQAQDSILNTNLEAQRRYREQSRLQGQQVASMAASGVDLGSGSALDVQQDTAAIGAEDIGQIYKAGNERTKGYEISAFNYNADAAAQRAKASGAIFGGVLSSFGTALGAASQIKGMSKPIPGTS